MITSCQESSYRAKWISIQVNACTESNFERYVSFGALFLKCARC